MARSIRGIGAATAVAVVIAGAAYGITNAGSQSVNDASGTIPAHPKAATQASATPKGPDCTRLKCVALTFDDGPGQYTDKILDELDAAGIKATFFEIGQNVGQYPQVVQRQVRDGMVIGNHTWNHVNLSHVSSERIRTELTRTSDALVAAGAPQPTLVRPPYGAYNARAKAVAGDLGMALITWDVDSQDWLNRNAARSRRNVMKEVTGGSIVLMHDIQRSTVTALPLIIADLKKRGYTFVTVPQLVGPTTAGVAYSRQDTTTSRKK